MDKIKEIVDKFVYEIAKSSKEPLDGDETEKIAILLHERLDEIFANGHSKKYAYTYWSAGDVLLEADDLGIEMTEEDAKDFIEEHEIKIKNAMIETGWHEINQGLRKLLPTQD